MRTPLDEILNVASFQAFIEANQTTYPTNLAYVMNIRHLLLTRSERAVGNIIIPRSVRLESGSAPVSDPLQTIANLAGTIRKSLLPETVAEYVRSTLHYLNRSNELNQYQGFGHNAGHDAVETDLFTTS
jgi:hypothetical protein